MTANCSALNPSTVVGVPLVEGAGELRVEAVDAAVQRRVASTRAPGDQRRDGDEVVDAGRRGLPSRCRPGAVRRGADRDRSVGATGKSAATEPSGATQRADSPAGRWRRSGCSPTTSPLRPSRVTARTRTTIPRGRRDDQPGHARSGRRSRPTVGGFGCGVAVGRQPGPIGGGPHCGAPTPGANPAGWPMRCRPLRASRRSAATAGRASRGRAASGRRDRSRRRGTSPTRPAPRNGIADRPAWSWRPSAAPG